MSKTKEKDFLVHMLAEQRSRVFGYLCEKELDRCGVCAFVPENAPGTSDHGSMFGCTGDRDNNGSDPRWVKLTPGCAKWRKVKGPFSREGFDAFYENGESKGKIWKTEETAEVPHEEKYLSPVPYLPGPLG